MTTIDRRYSVAEGIAVKAPCRVATTANIALTGLQTIDGITVVEHDRVLVMDQTTGAENGIYEASTGNWQRAKDWDGSLDVVQGTRIYVIAGAENGGREFTVSTASPIVIGTTAVAFSGSNLLTTAPTRVFSTHADLVNASPATGDTALVLGYYAANDGGGGLFNWKAGNFATQIAADPDGGVYPKAASIAASAGAWVRLFDGQNFYSKWFGTTSTDSTDQSAVINRAIATMALANTGRARTLRIEPGAKFDRTSLVFSMRGYLEFFPDDDLRANPYSTRASSEYIRFAFNANVDGIVNEFRFEAAYGCGLIVNVLKDAPGHDAYLAPVSSRIPTETVSSKTFIIAEDEYVPDFSIVSEKFGGGTKSLFDGTSIGKTRPRVILTMASTAALISTVGAKFEGLTSGAFGYFVSKTATTVTLDWCYSQFVAGEQLYDGAGGPYPTITNVLFSVVANQPMYLGTSVPSITFGLPPGRSLTDFGFGGRVTLYPTLAFGQNVVETVVYPGIVWMGAYASPSVGRQIILNADNRLVMINGTAQSTAAIGLVGACGAHVYFNNGAVVSSNAFNVATIVRNGTGDYTVNLTRAMLNADYSVALTPGHKSDKPVVVSKTASAINIANYDHATLAAANLTGILDVAIFGGK